MAETAVDKLIPYFKDIGDQWTAESPLPGGNFANIKMFTREVENEYPWLPEKMRARFIRSYGTRLFLLLKNATSMASLGHFFGADLLEKEINFLIETEWATDIEDIIWRRTKRGLYLTEQEQCAITTFIAGHPTIIAKTSPALIHVA